MREQEPGDAGVQRGDNEDGAAEADGIDADAVAHQTRAVQRADRAADAAVEQVGGHRHDDGNERPR